MIAGDQKIDVAVNKVGCGAVKHVQCAVVIDKCVELAAAAGAGRPIPGTPLALKSDSVIG